MTTGKPTNIRWRIMGILMLASFISYTLRYNMSAAAPAMMADLGLTEIQWGWILAAFMAGYTVFQVPGGLLGDRFGPGGSDRHYGRQYGRNYDRRAPRIEVHEFDGDMDEFREEMREMQRELREMRRELRERDDN